MLESLPDPMLIYSTPLILVTRLVTRAQGALRTCRYKNITTRVL